MPICSAYSAIGYVRPDQLMKQLGNESSIILHPASYVDRLPMDKLFDAPQPLEIELGAGDGSFLVAWAAQHPGRNFLGIERLLGRLRKIERKIRRAGLLHVRLLRIEAGYFLEYMVPPKSVTSLHIYFPDPWPKRKHWRHRLINEQFTRIVAGALVPGGTIYLRTDDAPYFADFKAVATPPQLQTVLTDFERGFHARGVSTLHAAYRLKSA
jgi:tRNA (guanine-N7-)-methyltransferase